MNTFTTLGETRLMTGAKLVVSFVSRLSGASFTTTLGGSALSPLPWAICVNATPSAARAIVALTNVARTVLENFDFSSLIRFLCSQMLQHYGTHRVTRSFREDY